MVTVVGLMLLVTFLPPDTSLKEVKAKGVIRACVPTRYPPLVTGDADRPGIDIELLRAVADHLGVRLLFTPSDAMGRDFNPRNWAINRGKCQLLAGGVVDSALTRSFLDTGPPYAETGWAIMAPAPLESIDGLTLGALTLVSGLDRIGLATYLRSHNVSVRVMRDDRAFVEGIAAGDLAGGISEALLASGLAAKNGWWAALMPDELARYNLVFGIWKGDLTLKRKIDEAFRQLHTDGTLAAILARYGAAPMGTANFMHKR
ncbi:transporter substrate-binding domain-containing protein [Silicimonas algicola]|nr:transporter substrate-binding domain-containing protein [Silicimonas algicola]AZQ66949.1 transporter substrate-binding domain-containing protein [Silicimonas algicola]